MDSVSSDPRVVAVLAAAAAPAESPLLGEAAALEAFRREYAVHRRSRWPFALTAKMAIAGGLGAALMAGGVAAAATGVPLGTPFGHHHSTSSALPVSGAQADAAPAGLTGEIPLDSPGHASRIATLATSTTTIGLAKGTAVCTAASKAKCRAGQHGHGSTGADGHRPAGTRSPNAHAGDHPTSGTVHRPATGTDHATAGRTTATTHIGLRPARSVVIAH